ncbi:MAG: Abi family protein [Rhizobiales bacterium]|nr:Abi family protein [Hyphomicrobiales bacterium]
MSTYMVAAGHDARYAIALYLYNARLSKAFLFPLHVVEIVLRNAIDETLCNLYGTDWPNNVTFNNVLTAESASALGKAKERARALEKSRNPPRSQIVATLNFDFWSNLFRSEYDRPLWQVNLHRTLPHCQAGQTRPDIQKRVREINRFRNRVAHHEPILDADVSAIHTAIVSLVGMRCEIAEDWLKHHSTVHAVIRTRPKHGGGAGPTVMDRCDTNFQTVNGSESIFAVMSDYNVKAPAIVRVDPRGTPTGFLTLSDILLYSHVKASDVAGMVDFNEHTIDDVIMQQGLADCWVALDTTTALSDAIDHLRKPGVQAIIAVEKTKNGGAAKGAILKAHRRY